MPMPCCSCRHALLVSVVLVLSSSAGLPRDFNGTYTIVNQASSRRMGMSSQGFFATARWPIVDEQKWSFVPQENSTYLIVNGKNNMRVLAQTGMDGEQGFFAVDSGPVYEDHKWRLELQNDGSYAIINKRSARRIFAEKNGDGGKGFSAVFSEGPIREEERWWLINQGKDETGKWLLKLDSAQRKNDKLGDNFKAKVGEILSIQAQMKNDWKTYSRELEASQGAASQLKQRMELEKTVNMALAEEVVVRRNETDHARSNLQVVEASKADLAQKMEAARADLQALSLQMQIEQTARTALLIEAEAMQGVLSCFFKPTDDSMLYTFKLILAFAVMVITMVLPCVRHRLRAAHSKAAVLAAELENVHSSKVHLEDDNIKKQAIIVKLEQDLDRLEDPPYPAGDLGHDFAFQVFHTDQDQSTMRLIKVQCPGVAHEDIEVQLIFNGCEVTISRKASQGVGAITWRRRFYFKPSEGLFEFKEDQMQLEHGFLHLVFAAYTFQSRSIRFPRHFALDSIDEDTTADLLSSKGGLKMEIASPTSKSKPRKKRLSLSNWWGGADDGELSTSPSPPSPVHWELDSEEAEGATCDDSGTVLLLTPRSNIDAESSATPNSAMAKKRLSLSAWWGGADDDGDDDGNSPCPVSPVSVMEVASPTRRRHSQGHAARDFVEATP